MGKKGGGSLFAALKRAITTILDKKSGDKRLWLFTKSVSNIQPTQLLKEETSSNYVLEANNCTDPTTVKQSFAAIHIQTAFRGYLARRASQALKGIVILQAMIRGQIVRNHAAIFFKCMQAHICVQPRLNTKPSRDESCKPVNRCRVSYSPEEHDAILQSRKDVKQSGDMKDFKERANRLVQWLETKHHGRSSYNPTVGQQVATLSPIKTIKESRYAFCRHNSDSNDMTTPNYMAATESTKAKTRSQCSPRQSPLTPKTKQIMSANKRLSYPVQDVSHNLYKQY